MSNTSWKKFKLGDIGEFSKGAGISKVELVEIGLRGVRYGELYTQHNVKVGRINSFISAKSAANSKQISKGDILFAGSGETIDDIGKSAVYLSDEPCYAGGDVIVFTPKHADPLYLAYYLNSQLARRDLRRLGQGQSVVHIYSRDLKNMELTLPSIKEQKMIVSLLDLNDKTIQLIAKKIAVKRNIKKSLNQQLLSGKLALSGSSGKLRPVTLGEIGKVSMCKRIFKDQTSDSGDIPFYKIGTFGKTPDAFISQSLYEEYRQKYSFPNKGDILISASGTIGRTVIYDGEPAYFQDSNIIWIANNEKLVLNSYLYHAYKHVTWHTAHGTIARLYNDNVMRIAISVPSLDEQSAIAKILNKADEEIKLLEKKHRVLVNQKDYLLNNLISGKIRLNESVSINQKESVYA